MDEPLARIIVEGIFEGSSPVSGMDCMRSYLLALLQELASVNDAASPRLILCVEEPELYQHPPQARHLATVLQNLGTGNSQIVISTHSPLIVSGEGFENVRMVHRNVADKRSTVTHMSYADIAAAVNKRGWYTGHEADLKPKTVQTFAGHKSPWIAMGVCLNPTTTGRQWMQLRRKFSDKIAATFRLTMNLTTLY